MRARRSGRRGSADEKRSIGTRLWDGLWDWPSSRSANRSELLVKHPVVRCRGTSPLRSIPADHADGANRYRLAASFEHDSRASRRPVPTLSGHR